MDFLAIDFETANSNNASACSLGMVFVSRHKIMHKKYYLIKPPGLRFDSINSKIHGITAKEVENAQTFDEVWKEIAHFFHPHCLVVAHNAQFDINVLKNCLIAYGLKEPIFNYFCSMAFTEPICKGSYVRKSLKARAEYYGIDLEAHHHALSDAEVCAQLVMRSVELQNKLDIYEYLSHNSSVPVKSFNSLTVQKEFIKTKTFKHNDVKASEMIPTVESISTSHPLFGKIIVFTGDLESLDRKEAMQYAVNAGAIPKNTVIKKTDYLVVGKQSSTLIGPEGISTKEMKAHDMLAEGREIQIIDEHAYLKLLGTVISHN